MSDVTASANPLRAYAAVTAAYWAFMLSDGALRMLVLLHFNALGFSPVQLAWLFLLYELAGIVTNLAAGWLAARFGLAATLYAGLALQIGALVVLAQLDPGWSVAASVAFVMAVQGVSGVAKDLAKMSSKSAVKLLAPTEDGGLFRWVAALTGSKNAVKGLGFFLGAALLALAGFQAAVWGMAGVLALILTAVILFLPAGLPGRIKPDEAWGGWRSTDPRVNRLSLARLFLFGARDVWFVVGVPVYFQSVLSDGTPDGRREAFFLIGGFLALWIIGYGTVQAFAPRLLGGRGRSEGETTRKAILWAGARATHTRRRTSSSPTNSPRQRVWLRERRRCSTPLRSMRRRRCCGGVSSSASTTRQRRRSSKPTEDSGRSRATNYRRPRSVRIVLPSSGPAIRSIPRSPLR